MWALLAQLSLLLLAWRPTPEVPGEMRPCGLGGRVPVPSERPARRSSPR